MSEHEKATPRPDCKCGVPYALHALSGSPTVHRLADGRRCTCYQYIPTDEYEFQRQAKAAFDSYDASRALIERMRDALRDTHRRVHESYADVGVCPCMDVRRMIAAAEKFLEGR